MGHGSRHRRPAQGRRHGRTQDGRQVAPTTSPRRSGSRAAKFIGATVALSLGAGVTAVMAGAADTGSAPTSLTVSALADTYVYQEYPGENRGAATKLTASNQTKLHTRSYLKFAVQGVPAGVTPKAHLLLSSDRNQPSAVELHAVADTGWNAMSMTMRNAPAVGAVVATAKPAARQTSLDFDLTGVVKGNGTYSFAMVAPQAGTVSAVFSSEHGADGPALALDWSGTAGTPAPAPSSAAPTQPALPSMSPLPPSPTTSGKPAPTSTSSSSAPAPAPAPSGGTLFGTSLWTGDGSNTAQALTRETGRVRPSGHRPDLLPGHAGGVAGLGRRQRRSGRSLVQGRAEGRPLRPAGRAVQQLVQHRAEGPADLLVVLPRAGERRGVRRVHDRGLPGGLGAPGRAGRPGRTTRSCGRT